MLLSVVGALIYTIGDTIRDGLSHRLPDSHTELRDIRENLTPQPLPKITSRGHHIDICGTEVYAAYASQCDALLCWLGPDQQFIHIFVGYFSAHVLRHFFIEIM